MREPAAIPGPPSGNPGLAGVIHLEATFRGSDGLELFRQQWRPAGRDPLAVLVTVHGIGDHSGLYPALPDYFVPRGWAVHSFDLRGNGRSPGPRGHIRRWSELRGDLDCFLATVRREDGERPLFLLGNSLGGLVVLDYALHHGAGLSGVIAVAPPLGRFGTPRWLLAVGRVLSRIWPAFTLETRLDLAGLSRDAAVRDAIVSDPLFHRKGSARLAAEVLATARSVRQNAGAFAVPLLLIHGGADRMVFPEGSRAFYAEAGPADKQYLEYPGAYHALFADLDREQVLADLERWMRQRLT